MKHAVSKIFSCALAAAFVLTGCMGSSSGPAGQSGSTSGASSQSGQSSTVQTAAPEKWRAGLGVLTQSTGQDKSGKLNTITASVVLDGEGKIRDVVLDELELTVTTDGTGRVNLPSDHRTKRQKGSDYPLAEASSLKAGWAQQADAFGHWLVGKTPEQLRSLPLDADGKAKDADLLSGCTIAVDGYRSAILQACENARKMG